MNENRIFSDVYKFSKAPTIDQFGYKWYQKKRYLMDYKFLLRVLKKHSKH